MRFCAGACVETEAAVRTVMRRLSGPVYLKNGLSVCAGTPSSQVPISSEWGRREQVLLRQPAGRC
jgi:hypothetical protein